MKRRKKAEGRRQKEEGRRKKAEVRSGDVRVKSEVEAKSKHMATAEEYERARRLARAIASDISIYYGEKIQRGLENDNLFDEIAGELQEGVALFQQKIPHEIVNNTNLFERAIIDVIVASRGHIRTKIF